MFESAPRPTANAHMKACMQTHTLTQTQKRDTHTQTKTQHTLTRSSTHAHTQTHTHTNVNTHTHTHSHTHACVRIPQVRSTVNRAFYGLPVTANDLLVSPWAMAPPPAAATLYEALADMTRKVCAIMRVCVCCFSV